MRKLMSGMLMAVALVAMGQATKPATTAPAVVDVDKLAEMMPANLRPHRGETPRTADERKDWIDKNWVGKTIKASITVRRVDDKIVFGRVRDNVGVSMAVKEIDQLKPKKVYAQDQMKVVGEIESVLLSEGTAAFRIKNVTISDLVETRK